ncbi:MAG: hypothetical protein ABI707_14210 [Ferruginibacter sp.]
MKKTPINKDEISLQKNALPQNLNYPASEDIYNQGEKLPLGDEDAQEIKGEGEEIMGTDLDVPGAELDDKNEAIGEEDEENNYYSLGGDNHNDLDEDNGE